MKLRTPHYYLLLVLGIGLLLSSGCNDLKEQGGKSFSISGVVKDPDGDMDRFYDEDGVALRLLNSDGGLVRNVKLNALEDKAEAEFSLTDIPSGEYRIEAKGIGYRSVSRHLSLRSDEILDIEMELIRALETGPEELVFGPREYTKSITVKNVWEEPVSFSIKAIYNADGTGIESGALSFNGLGGLSIVGHFWVGELKPGESKEIPVRVFHRERGDVNFDLAVTAQSLNESVGKRIHVTVRTTDESFYASLSGRVLDKDNKPVEGAYVTNNCSNTLSRTDADGKYSFGLIPYISSIYVSVYSEHHFEKTLSESYTVDDHIMDFVLEDCPNHLTFDRNSVDFGTGSVKDDKMVYFDIGYVADKTPASDARLDCLSINETVARPGFITVTASAVLNKEGQLRFSLNRSNSRSGEHSFNLLVKTTEAGSYIIPVHYSVTEDE